MAKSSLRRGANVSTRVKKAHVCANNILSQAGVTKRIPKQKEQKNNNKFQWNSEEKEFLER